MLSQVPPHHPLTQCICCKCWAYFDIWVDLIFTVLGMLMWAAAATVSTVYAEVCAQRSRQSSLFKWFLVHEGGYVGEEGECALACMDDHCMTEQSCLALFAASAAVLVQNAYVLTCLKGPVSQSLSACLVTP